MTFTSNSTGGKYQEKITKNNIPNYEIGFMPAAVPGNHAKWNNGGIIGSDGGKPTDKQLIYGDNSKTPDGNTVQWGWRIRTNGGGAAMNIENPYITVYFWRRTN